MSDALVLAIDNGTSSTKCLVVDDRGRAVARGLHGADEDRIVAFNGIGRDGVGYDKRLAIVAP